VVTPSKSAEKRKIVSFENEDPSHSMTALKFCTPTKGDYENFSDFFQKL
jgi:hypothetical protein